MSKGLSSAIAVVAAGVALGPPAASAATYSDSKFVERTVASALTQPVGTAWAPDGRLFVIEKAGVVRTLPPNAPEDSTPVTLLDLRQRVNSSHDRGLLGVAVDSQFSTHPYLYLAYTLEPNPFIPDSSAAATSRIVKIRLADGGASLADPAAPEQVILGTEGSPGPCPAVPDNDLDCIPSDSLSHSIGTVRSAPDGTLYAGSGDASGFNAVDPQALRALDESSLAGKIVHVDREGKGLQGHSFCPGETDLSRVCTKLYAKGLRNPFRFNLRPDGSLAVGDVGWGTKEEIDLLEEGGADLGWPCREGTLQTSGYRDLPACQSEYAKTPQTHRPPDYSYNHLPGLGGAVVGGPDHPGTPYPGDFRGALFFGDYAQGFLRFLERDANGALLARPFASDWSGTDLELTPAGELAYVDPGDFSPGTGSLKRIVYSAPVAEISAGPTNGVAPLEVSFDGGRSRAPDSGNLSYSWDFGDGSPVSTSAEASHTYGPGEFVARLTVTAEDGATASDTVRISSGNTAPTAQIASPTPGARYRGGQNIDLRGSGADNQDGPLPDAQLEWQINTVHREHVHPDSRSGAEASFEAPTDHDADSHLELTLTATDSHGLRGTDKVRLDPQTAPLRLRSAPTGQTISWAGTDVHTPFDGVAAVGFRTSVSTAASLIFDSRPFAFLRWSDGGARQHEVTVPAGGVSLSATYRDTTATPPEGGKPPSSPAKAPEDRLGPKLTLTRFDGSKRVVAGRVSDPSGVKAVKLGLLKRAGRRCRFWSVRLARFGKPRSCRQPRLLTARVGRGRWRLALGRRLPVGTYRLLGTARDRRGNLTRRFTGAGASKRLAFPTRRR